MPIPSVSAVSQTARKVALPGAFSAMAVFSGFRGYQDRVRQGQNPIMAALMEGAAIAPQFLLNPNVFIGMQLGVPLVRASAAYVVGAVREHNNFIRQAKTPFSHRFEHTETTSRAQMLGLQQIGAAWGHARMGSEAAAFASRYGR